MMSKATCYLGAGHWNFKRAKSTSLCHTVVSVRSFLNHPIAFTTTQCDPLWQIPWTAQCSHDSEEYLRIIIHFMSYLKWEV